ncbi:MAG: hypothetical protein KGH71_00360 [Candidatus Micrarchaeota archaeon]|nr:hypothetical protein [Candidatus Micrarchaeota archaeon]
MVFLEINLRAATITGAVVGFLCWILGLGIGFGGMPMYGFMNGMMGYYMLGYSGYTGLYVIALVVVGGILGAIIALVYNWALRTK